MFGKSKKKEVVKPCISEEFKEAKEIAKQYDQLSQICRLISDVQPKTSKTNETSLRYIPTYGQGWRIWNYQLKNSGIDEEEVYEFIKKLALKRKAELECFLSKI